MSEDGDPTLAKLCKQLEDDVIGVGVRNAWLGGTGDVRVSVTGETNQGATDAIIFRARVELDFHVKMSFSQVARERQGYELLASTDGYQGHLVPPLFHNVLEQPSSDAVMLVPYMNAVSLSQLLLSDSYDGQYVLDLYDDFLESSKRVWLGSWADTETHLRPLYWRRMRERSAVIGSLIGIDEGELQDLELIVNGASCGLVGDMFNEFLRRLDSVGKVLPGCCITHGDENPTNIMVPYDAQEYQLRDGWVLIDYVSASDRNDWIMSIAKLLQHWRVGLALRKAGQDADVRAKLACDSRLDGSQLLLSYSGDGLTEILPEICGALEARTLAVAESVANEIGDTRWRERLELAACSSAIGSAAVRMSQDPLVLPVYMAHAMAWR